MIPAWSPLPPLSIRFPPASHHPHSHHPTHTHQLFTTAWTNCTETFLSEMLGHPAPQLQISSTLLILPSLSLSLPSLLVPYLLPRIPFLAASCLTDSFLLIQGESCSSTTKICLFLSLPLLGSPSSQSSLSLLGPLKVLRGLRPLPSSTSLLGGCPVIVVSSPPTSKRET